MPRIAFFLATSGHSGVDRIMASLITELARLGFNVDLLHIKNHGPYLPEVPENVSVIQLGTSHVGSSLFAVIRYLRKYRPDSLLSDKDKVNRIAIIASLIAASSTKIGVRIGTTVSRNLKARKASQRFLQLLSIRWLYPHAHCVIVPSEGAATDLADIGKLPISHIRALPSPVVSDHMYQQSRKNVDLAWLKTKKCPVIIGVGELSDRKDFQTLIKAFHIASRRRKLKLIILGEGRKRRDLEQLIKSLGLEEDVILPGFVKNPYSYMSKSDVFVLSSKWEGAPVVLMEALALVPGLVSTRCPSGPEEILQNGRLGHLVPIGDSNSMAQALLQAIDQPVEKEALEKAANRFTVKNSAQMYLEALGLEHKG